ncbi:hypothetical protein ACUOA9_39150, partial [Escherichia sp. HC-TM1]
ITIKDVNGDKQVIPLANSQYHTAIQFMNETFATVLDNQQSNIQLEKTTVKINKKMIKKFNLAETFTTFNLTGKLIEVDKQVVFSED